jgi:hypothetical protein
VTSGVQEEGRRGPSVQLTYLPPITSSSAPPPPAHRPGTSFADPSRLSPLSRERRSLWDLPLHIPPATQCISDALVDPSTSSALPPHARRLPCGRSSCPFSMRNPFPTRPTPHCCHRIGSAGGVLGHSLHSPAQRSFHPCLSFALLLPTTSGTSAASDSIPTEGPPGGYPW